jgi:hypothetical protein
MEVQVNIWAVLLAALSSIIVGWVWYTEPVFGKEWMKLAKLNSKIIQEKAAPAMVVATLSSLLMAYILAVSIFLVNYFYGNSYLQDALVTGIFVFFGFQGFRTIMHDGFEQRRRKLTLINIGNDFVTIMVMALIIGVMSI